MNLFELVRHAGRLYSLPTVCIQLQDAIQRQATVHEIADLVALDPSLSARLLRLANSSFYSFPAQIETVSRAVKLIGTNELYNLALATSAVATFQRIPPVLIDMDSFWKHSVYTGLIARIMGRQVGFRQGERLFAAGLLHNVGLLMLLEQIPDPVAKVLAMEAGLVDIAIERAELEFSFAEAGAALMEYWRLPPGLVNVVRFQHEPELAGQEDIACALIGLGGHGGRHLMAEYAPTADSEYLAAISLQNFTLCKGSREQFAEAMKQAQLQAIQVASILTSGSIAA